MSPTAPTLLQDLSSWLIVFGGLSTIVVLVVLAATLIGRGFSGVSALLGSLLADWPRKIGAAVGCLAMAAGEAWAGWKVMPMVATFVADKFGKLPLPAMLTASSVVGGLIGLVAGALTGLVSGAAIVDALCASPRRVLAIASLVF